MKKTQEQRTASSSSWQDGVDPNVPSTPAVRLNRCQQVQEARSTSVDRHTTHKRFRSLPHPFLHVLRSSDWISLMKGDVQQLLFNLTERQQFQNPGNLEGLPLAFKA